MLVAGLRLGMQQPLFQSLTLDGVPAPLDLISKYGSRISAIIADVPSTIYSFASI